MLNFSIFFLRHDIPYFHIHGHSKKKLIKVLYVCTAFLMEGGYCIISLPIIITSTSVRAWGISSNHKCLLVLFLDALVRD